VDNQSNVPRSRQAAAVLGIIAVFCPRAIALNPLLEVNQYAHTAWTAREGFFNGAINAIGQDRGGYLLLATELGLLRFDGVRPTPWPTHEPIAREDSRSVFAASDGRLWIGMASGLCSLKDGHRTDYPELAGQRVLSILEDTQGTVWVAGYAIPAGRLCAFRDGKVDCAGMAGEFARGVTFLYQSSSGELWAGAANGLWRWRPSPPKRYATPGASSAIRALAKGGGSFLIAMQDGIRQLVGEEVKPYPPLAEYEFLALCLLKDREGGLWVGTGGQGLLHLRQSRVDRFTRMDGLSGDTVNSIFEDREGSIWVGTDGGLDRFRDLAAPGISTKQGLSNADINSVMAARDGSIWLGTQNGLDRLKDGEMTIYKRPGGSPVNGARPARVIFDNSLPDDNAQATFEDSQGRIWVCSPHGVAYFESGRLNRVSAEADGFVSSIAGDRSGNLWVSDEYNGLIHYSGARKIEQVPWAKLGRPDYASAMVSAPSENGVWLGFRNGGVAYFKDGRLRESYAGDTLGHSPVNGLTLDADGIVWASTESGLSRVHAGTVMTLTTRNGLPCNAVNWMAEDQDRSVWIYMACGLARITRSELTAWSSNPAYVLKVMAFQGSDGVMSHSLTTASSAIGHVPGPSLAPDGKLWFSAIGGASFIDPRHLPFNNSPPPVHIERILADQKLRWQNLWTGMASNLHLPPLNHDLEIDYTALSFVAPEQNRFKFKLEGFDRDWIDVGNRRQAFYTNLPPRQYRFRVIACNNSGVWNEAGDALDFSIAPAFYQTNWFRAACVAGFVVLIWLGYRLRLRQVQRESRKLRDVIETIPAYVWSAQPDGSVDFVNRRWLELAGFSLDQALGWGWTEALHPEDRDRFIEGWRAAVAAGKAMEAEARMRSTDGEYRWLLFRSVPLRDRSGKIVKWYGKSMDIEALKRAEQERESLRQLESELAHINRVSMMGELAASVAHEVNQPLTGIVSNGSAGLRMLSGGAPDLEEIRGAFADIVRDGKRAGEVIARIRAMTKRVALPRERLDLNEVIREVLVLVRDEAKKRMVSVHTEFADGIGLTGDRVQLQQVVLNLVMNAMEAMSSVSGWPRELVLYTRNVDGGEVEVTVEDSGVGLDPKTMATIFQPFYTTKSSGMGMGLSICRSIVQNHGGRLWVTANEGPGASFHFTLPQYHEEERNARGTGA
jgi:PAS domain S-box-containing protein